MNLNKHILELLKRIGLTESEAKFFITAYCNPKLTIKNLQHESGLSIASTYRAYEHLKEMGLVTSSPDSWRKNIETVSLATLSKKIAKEQRKLRKIELELKKLNNLMNISALSNEEEAIQILTDQNQIVEQNYKILHNPLKDFSVYGSADRLVDILGYDNERDFVRIRNKQGKAVNAFMTEYGEYSQECIRKGDLELRNNKLKVDPNNQDYMTYIYDNEVTIWYRDKEFGNRAIIIKDPSMVAIQRNMFDTIWQSV